ncbi:hypothetical protein CQ018_12965 [Arthrobacter sp. MYb227]|uniref:hypothetical protein n=1 Tax=Arthrobacter sp. MYb227 TaxID=1848601 RepID=UPI000CFB7A7F|nr:hypothetical protein [Arthrobacter sp. MYb227]PQZ91553.1 hypothetical protein CQ018_12965 [Arthrobacter sp. MYb227]
MMKQHKHRPAKRLWIGLLSLMLVASPLAHLATAVPAEAAPRISVVSSLGQAKASASGPTSVTVSGSGLQSIPKAFGGIYVTFGYLKNSGGWRPSQGGKAGEDFFYIADAQSKNNQGYQRFVAFPGSSTSDSANGGTISASGSFKLKMVIPGPTFNAESSTGSKTNIDCRQVQCGIITFGAHGVANGNNESFTPLSFGAAKPAAATTKSEAKGTATQQTQATQQPAIGNSGATTQQTQQGQGSVAGTEHGTTEQVPTTGEPQSSGTIPQAVTSGNPVLGIEQKTVVAGRTLGFTGRGFAPGEQVVGTLAAGITAAGPITAGTFGEVAGVVQIPSDMAAGTHKLKLAGAGSGASVEAEFSVMANPAALASTAAEGADGVWWALVAVIIAGSILLLVFLVSFITALARRRSETKTRPVRRKKLRPAARKRNNTAPRPTVPRRQPQSISNDEGFGASFDSLYSSDQGSSSVAPPTTTIDEIQKTHAGQGV